MILILTDLEEPTTDLVIEWLLYLNKDFIRISSRDPVLIHEIYMAGNGIEAIIEVKCNNHFVTIDTANITSYWYRRSFISTYFKGMESIDKQVVKLLNQYHESECKSALQILHFILESKKHINKFDDADRVCKVWNLKRAKDCYLTVPDTIICSSKEQLRKFWDKHKGKIITKSIGDPTMFFEKGTHSYTSQVDIEALPDTFALSLFQEMIEKEFELRVFYLNGEFYGSAIFSQNDPQTQVDFKKYNDKKPNRVVRFELPFCLKKNLTTFMDSCDLNCGSIDLVYAKSKEIYFLEVNPIGQFEQVSVPCNYNLLKKIAEIL